MATDTIPGRTSRISIGGADTFTIVTTGEPDAVEYNPRWLTFHDCADGRMRRLSPDASGYCRCARVRAARDGAGVLVVRPLP